MKTTILILLTTAHIFLRRRKNERNSYPLIDAPTAPVKNIQVFNAQDTCPAYFTLEKDITLGYAETKLQRTTPHDN